MPAPLLRYALAEPRFSVPELTLPPPPAAAAALMAAALGLPPFGLIFGVAAPIQGAGRGAQYAVGKTDGNELGIKRNETGTERNERCNERAKQQQQREKEGKDCSVIRNRKRKREREKREHSSIN